VVAGRIAPGPARGERAGHAARSAFGDLALLRTQRQRASERPPCRRVLQSKGGRDFRSRALQILRDDRSASLVSVQRFRGKLAGLQGSFVLQGSEVVEDGKIKGTWYVVPGSGTAELRGLRGEGDFEGQFGKASRGRLDYWFE
jgi:hypothetical protein